MAEECRRENLGPEADSLGSYASPDTDMFCDLGIVSSLCETRQMDDSKLQEPSLVSSPKSLPIPQEAGTQGLLTPPPGSQQSWWLLLTQELHLCWEKGACSLGQLSCSDGKEPRASPRRERGRCG